MLIKSGEYVRPEKTLKNIESLLLYTREKGMSDNELYYAVKLILAMFD